MTNFMTKIMIAAATAVVAVGAASAQTLKAEIPFSFRANGVVMAPGTYRVNLDRGIGGVPFLYLYGMEAKKSVVAQARVPHDAPKAVREAGNPVLTFQCGEKMCTLTDVWAGRGEPAYGISGPKSNEPTHIALITMLPDKAD